MNCEEIEQLVLLQDSGEISADQAQILLHHLSHCPACRKFGDDLLSLRGELFTASCRDAEPSQKALVSIRKAAKQHHSSQVRIFSHPWPIALAAAASLILCLTTLRFSALHSAKLPLITAQDSLATEIIPLIAMITGTEINQVTMDGDEPELTVLANELLRLQDMAVEWPGEVNDTLIPPEDYQPTTLLWNNIPESLSGRYG